MKKFLGILAIAGTLVACNNSSDTPATNTDSARIADSIRVADSINAANNSMMNTTPVDSTHMNDSANKAADSTKK